MLGNFARKLCHLYGIILYHFYGKNLLVKIGTNLVVPELAVVPVESVAVSVLTKPFLLRHIVDPLLEGWVKNTPDLLID